MGDIIAGPIYDSGGAVYNVRHPRYRAAGDGKEVTDGAIASGSTVLTSAAAKFTSSDVGRTIWIVKSTGVNSTLLATTIASYDSPSQVTLANAMPATISSALVLWGTDDTDAIQAALNDAAAVHGTVCIPPGVYLLTRSLTLHSDVALEGAHGAFPYSDPTMPTLLKAVCTFADDTSVIDARERERTTIRWLGIDMVSAQDAGNNIAGIEYGVRSVSELYSQHEVEHCSITNGFYGIRGRNSGLLKVRDNNISGHRYAGVYLDQCGDCDFDGNYINTCNPDYAADSLYQGAGIVFSDNSSNCNLRGGKIEWNAKGILIDGSNGINISGVNFDVNRTAHIVIAAERSPIVEAYGFSITNCRFLAGGTNVLTSLGELGGVAIHILAASGLHAVGTIVGNTFRKGGDAGYDLNPAPPVGPVRYAVLIEGNGTGRVAIVGNDMYQCAEINAFCASGADIVIEDIGNLTDLSAESWGGGTIVGHGRNVVDAHTAFLVNGTQVVGQRGAAVGMVNGTAGASYGAAEQTIMNDLVAVVNTIISRLSSANGHGLIT